MIPFVYLLSGITETDFEDKTYVKSFFRPFLCMLVLVFFCVYFCISSVPLCSSHTCIWYFPRFWLMTLICFRSVDL